MLFLFCLVLCFYYGAFHVEHCLALCSHVVFNPFNIEIIFWGRESWSICLSCLCSFILHALFVVVVLFLLMSETGCDL